MSKEYVDNCIYILYIFYKDNCVKWYSNGIDEKIKNFLLNQFESFKWRSKTMSANCCDKYKPEIL